MTSNWRLPWKPRTIGLRDFTVFGDGGMNLWQLLQAGQFVEYKPHRMLFGRPASWQTENEHVDPKLCSGRSASRSAGCEVMKIHAWRFFDHFASIHSVLASVFLEQPETVGDEAQRASTPERWCGADGSISEASRVFFTRGRSPPGRHPCTKLLRRGQFEKQMGDIFSAGFR